MQIVMQKSSMDWLQTSLQAQKFSLHSGELLIREDTQQSQALHPIRARNGESQLGFWRMVEVILCWVTSRSIIPFAELAVLQGPVIQIEFLLRAEEVRLPLYWVGFGLVTLLDSSQIVLMEEEFET